MVVGGQRERYDVIVAGVGGMGSATAYHLAARGLRVLGLERYDIPHEMGSSHGHTRVIRLAYFEHPSYVPLLRRAYALWRDLESRAGEQLLTITGSIDAGPPGARIFEGSREACEMHGLEHEILTSAELSARFPGYRLPPETRAVLQPDGGFLTPERCIVAYVTLAQSLGAEIRTRDAITSWEATGDGVRVSSDRAVYEADRLVVTAGAWAGKLVAELGATVTPERQVLGWFQPRDPALFQPSTFPVFNLSVDEGHFYGLPIHGAPGVKVGRYHHLEEACDPDAVDRECHPRDEEVLRSFVERYLPAGAGPTMALKACLFSNTPDEHFILDRHPEYAQVAIAAGFSGHGFKFCSVVGEIMADLTERGETSHDIGMFRLQRFTAVV